MIWAAGVAASPAAKWLGAEKDRAGRVKVNPDLTLPDHPEIFVIGDTATVAGADGKPVPGVAPAAKQQGAFVAAMLRRRAREGEGAAEVRPASATAISARWPPSAGHRRSPISAGSG